MINEKHENITVNSNHERIQITPGELYEAKKILILEELQNDLLKWIKRRFWWVNTLLIVAGFLGLSGLINQLISFRVDDSLEEANRAINKAEIMLGQAENTAGALISSFNETQGKVNEYLETVNKLKSDAITLSGNYDDLHSKFESETNRIIAVVQRKTSDSENRFERLQELVQELASLSEESRIALADYQKQMRVLNDRIVEDDIAFLKNSNVSVEIVFDSYRESDAGSLLQSLTKAGFKTSTSPYGQFEKPSRKSLDTNDDYISLPIWVLKTEFKNHAVNNIDIWLDNAIIRDDVVLVSEELKSCEEQMQKFRRHFKHPFKLFFEGDIKEYSFSVPPYAIKIYLVKHQE